MHGLATNEIHNSKLSCSAQFRTFTTQSQEITLNILYKPVAVSLTLENKAVTEGGSIFMECDAKSNPRPHTYSWFRRKTDQTDKISSTRGRMSFHNITRDTSVSCMAHNDIGVGQSDWADVDVHYAPVILPESSCSRTENMLRCVCRAEASPNASIYWTIDGNHTLSSSFTSNSTNQTHVVSGYLWVPAEGLNNVSCTARNLLGSDTKQMSVGSWSETSSLLTWVSCLIALGVVLLIGCSIFSYRKYSRNRSQDCLGNVHEEENRYDTCQRSQVDDTQSGQKRSERNSEVDRLSCVYDNDCVEEMRRSHWAEQHGNNATAVQREGGLNPLTKGDHCDMSIYLNS
ncbi:carcinoembryonic antigen-related cell adhesion molecule 5-like isoform X1 [Amphiprion ocellaris]|nr:carcinoembryonic antigen-related cell adhesion molecule 5-like isoform X1 [Amphiprion ocellaris]